MFAEIGCENIDWYLALANFLGAAFFINNFF